MHDIPGSSPSKSARARPIIGNAEWTMEKSAYRFLRTIIVERTVTISYQSVLLVLRGSICPINQKFDCPPNVGSNTLSEHGIPKIVISDNGPPFSSAEFARYATTLGITHQFSTPYLQQANGEVGRFFIGVSEKRFK